MFCCPLSMLSALTFLAVGILCVSGIPRFGTDQQSRSLYYIHCPQPAPIPEREYSIIYALEIQKYSTKLHPGTEISFQCHNGYRLKGNSVLRCGSNGKWDQDKMPECVKVGRQAACGPPPILLHGGYRSDSNNPNRVNFFCLRGYKLDDAVDPAMVCKDGQWSGAPLECFETTTCPDLGPVENGRYECLSGTSSGCLDFNAGATVSIVCDRGYERTGPYSLTCEASGKWSNTKASCARKTCPNLGIVPHGQYRCITKNCLQFAIGAIVGITCNDGYGFKDTYMYTLTCRNDGMWSAEKPECVEMKGCHSPLNIHNGQWTLYGQFTMVKYDMFGVGTTVFYQCDKGYKLKGTEEVMCMNSGTWSGEPPVCEPEFSCQDPGPVENGRFELTTASCISYMSVGVKCEQYDIGSKLVFLCDDGYERNGNYELECGASGSWLAEKPTCVKAPTSVPQDGSHENTTNTMTIVIITSCSVLGILLITMIIVAFQRRKPQANALQQVQAPPPYCRSARTTVEEHDRVALIAYADGAHATLPTYDEAVRGPRTRVHGSNPRYSQSLQATGYRPLPSIPGSVRRQQSDGTCCSLPLARDPDGVSRHSTITTSTVNRDAFSETFGSLDTMNTVNISDGTSTSVTVDTYDSGASLPSIAASRRATAGSMESNTSLGFSNEDAPLLEQNHRHASVEITANDCIDDVKEE